MKDATLCDRLVHHIEVTVRPRMDDVLAGMDGNKSLMGAYLKFRLGEEGVSVSDLASSCGVTRQFAYAIMNGTNKAPDAFLRDVSTYTDIAYEELLAVRAIEGLLSDD